MANKAFHLLPITSWSTLITTLPLICFLWLHGLPVVSWTWQPHFCLGALHSLSPLPGILFFWTPAWRTVSFHPGLWSNVRSSERPLLDNLSEKKLSYSSLLHLAIFLHSSPHELLSYYIFICLWSVLECKFHEGKDFISFIHHYISNASIISLYLQCLKQSLVEVSIQKNICRMNGEFRGQDDKPDGTDV